MHKRLIHQLGFTLLELLVVISIIAILVAIGAASYSTAQKTARDARRRGDIKALQNALEQFYSKNGTYVGGCTTANISPYIQGGVPLDPKTKTAYACPTLTATSYCILATLDDTTGGNCSAACADATNGPAFCLRNLQ